MTNSQNKKNKLMGATVKFKFAEAKSEIYSFVKAEPSKGINEFDLKNKISEMERKYSDLDIKDALENLIDKGYIKLNYSENSFVGYYFVNQ